jgi:hypothetical protein
MWNAPNFHLTLPHTQLFVVQNSSVGKLEPQTTFIVNMFVVHFEKRVRFAL